MPARSEPYDAPAIVTFAKELTAWREASVQNKKQLADALGYADSYIGQIERCKNTPSPEFAEALDTFFKTNGLFRRLWERIIETRYSRTRPPGFEQYLEYEVNADRLRIYCTSLVSGLFQTEGYARTIMSMVGGPIAEQRLRERLARQEILGREDGPYAFLVLDEVVIRRTIGSGEVMREQLAHLLEAGQSERTQVQIVPYGVGYYAGLSGSLTLLGFTDRPDVSYTESSGEGLLLERHDSVAHQILKWDQIQGHTLSVAESLAVIQEAMERL
ncbi:helix-turn-helix transcriptional regulator [Spirillospora sp. NPDC047279]|uniref:helix-turn-helix domain-containing protein n=1 Tax=Spirillospora sp. NPDC047279 TaxID=3155478 RepID=UPI003411D7CB